MTESGSGYESAVDRLANSQLDLFRSRACFRGIQNGSASRRDADTIANDNVETTERFRRRVDSDTGDPG
jgi:hypothetical protein